MDVAGFLELGSLMLIRVSFPTKSLSLLRCELHTHLVLFAELWGSAGL